MLTSEEKEKLRSEEEFRSLVRQEIAARASPPGAGRRVWTFLNSQFGGWLLGTVVVAGVSFGFTTYISWRNQDQLREQAERQRAREDGQTVSALLPYLGSDSRTVAQGAAVLLTHLSEHGIDKSLGASLREVLATYQQAATSETASEAQRGGAEASVALQDSVSDSGQVTPAAAAAAATECHPPQAVLDKRDSDLSWSTSPRRVYLHIAAESQRPLANQLAASLRAAGYLVPGVENVGETRSPRATEIRFFNEDDQILAQQVFDLIKDSVPDLATPKCPPLYARRGHLEVFLSLGAGG
jgi:hypothetical protein